MSRFSRMFQGLKNKKVPKKISTALMSMMLVAMQITAAVSPFLLNTQTARAADTGFKVPASTNDDNDDSSSWDTNTVANVQTSDNVYATDDDEDDEQDWTGFNFAVPAGSTINGIEAKVEAKSTDSAGCEMMIRLSWNDGASNTSTKDAELNATDNTYIFGGASDAWGRTWTAAEVNDPNFVLKVNVDDLTASNGGSCDNGAIFYFDQIQAKVYYTLPPALSDLQVSKVNNVASSVVIGNPFTWTFSVTNTGLGSATFTSGQDIFQDNMPDSNVTYSPLSNLTISTAGGVTGTIDCDIDNNDDVDCDASGGPVVIPSGASFSFSTVATPTSVGSYANPRNGGGSKCQVDPDGLISEANENNNNCSNTVTVTNTQPGLNPSLPMSCGLDIALVLDNSTSISSGEMTSMKSAMTAFTTALTGTPTEFSVTKFATTASVEETFTDNIGDVNDAIDGIPVGGGYTNWEDGFIKAASTLPNRSNPNLVIFASDGNPNTVGNGPGDNASPDGSPAAMNPAIAQANALKAAGTRVLAIGIGSDLSVANLQAISGSNVDTGDVLTSDVITSDFATLAADLAEFAEQTCGGTITIEKVIDGDGDPQTQDYTPGVDWDYAINGGAGNIYNAETGIDGMDNVEVNDATYSITETLKDNYKVLDVKCVKNGEAFGNWQSGVTISNLTVDNNDIVNCKFINTLKERVTVPVPPVCEAQQQLWTVVPTADFPKLATDNSFRVANALINDTRLSIDTGLTFAQGTVDIAKYLSWDGYVGRISTPTQPEEQWAVQFWYSGSIVATSTLTDDLADGVTTDSKTGSLGQIYLPNGADKVLVVHKAALSNIGTNPNSVVPAALCLKFEVPETTLIVNKIMNNQFGGNKKADDFSFKINEGTTFTFESDGSNSYSVDPGVYSVVENAVTGYSASYNNCTNVNIPLGGTATCTITNSDVAPLLTVIKNVKGGTLTVPDFPLFVDGNSVVSGAQNSYNAGKHTISETQQEGYTFTGVTGDCYIYNGAIKVVLSIGGVYTCTLTNESNPTIKLIKVVTNNSGGTKGPNDFGLTIGDTEVQSGQVLVVPADTDIALDEEGAKGYEFVSMTGDGCPTKLGDTVNLEPGQNLVCTITNDDKAPKLYVKKIASPSDQQSFGFTLTNNGNQYANFSLPNGGVYNTGGGLDAGSVVITEHETAGWYLEDVDCWEIGKYKWTPIDTEFEAELGKKYWCTFKNEKSGEVIVTKFHDINENGHWDEGEPALPDWDMTITPFENSVCDLQQDNVVSLTDQSWCENYGDPITQTTGEDGTTTFTGIKSGYYKLEETLKDEWLQSALYCDDFRGEISLNTVALNEDTFYAGAGQTVRCYVGNHLKPNYIISKANDALTPLFRGNLVKYTITITVPDSSNSGIVHSGCEGEETCENVDQVAVVDLPPNGVKYIPGSWNATMTNGEGTFDLKALGITPEPTYGSPGVWFLTNISNPVLLPGSVITLTYLGTVLNSAALGTHKDGAFSRGFDNGGNTVYALGANNTPFVGTQVAVVEPEPEAQTYVLGLTDTGDITKFGSLIGAVMIFAAIAVTSRKGKKGMTKVLGWLLFVPVMIVLFSAQAHAATPVFVQLNQPQSPTKAGNFNLDYTVLTVDGSQSFDVTLYRNGVAVGTQSVSHENGNSGSFPTNLFSDGTYTFKAKATVTSGPDTGSEYETATVVVAYDGSAPAPISYGGKTVSGNTYTFRFTAPVGTDAVKALVFASPSTNFPLNASTHVGTIAITPGVQQTFSYTAPSNAPYYFAALLVDAAGNVSSPGGDREAAVVAQASSGNIQTASTSSSTGSDSGDSTDVLSAADVAKLATLLGDNSDQAATTAAAEDNDDSTGSRIAWIIAIALAIAAAAYGINWYSKRKLDD